MVVSNLRGRPVMMGALAWIVSVGAVGLASAHDEFQQHGVHQHGLVTVNVALDGPDLRVELHSPADSVIGFERAPASDEERARVGEVHGWLRSGRGLVFVSAAAGCRLVQVQLTAPQWQAHHDHDHDHDHVTGQHQDYRVSVDYHCRQPAALAWLQLKILEGLRDVQQVRVQVLTSTSQTGYTLTDPAQRVVLK